MAEAGVDGIVITDLSNVRYLTGLSASAGAALLTSDRCVLVVDFRYGTVARELPLVTSGHVELRVIERGHDEAIAAILRDTGTARAGVEGASMTVGRFARLSTLVSAAGATGSPAGPVLVAVERIVERSRRIKDGREIAALREGARRLSHVASEIPRIAVAGRTEREVAGEIDLRLRLVGFERPAFETIVASGPQSALPHARPSHRRLETDELVVLDFGGVYDGYCVDLTRTLLLGHSVPALRRLFDAVVEAHGAAIAAVRPGVLPSQIDAAARDVLAHHGLAEAFGHATGHGLGLDVHEEPRIGRASADRSEEPIEPGMVFTIEPGVYVPGLGGVRIEDDVLVVEGGCELLTDVAAV